MSATLFAKGLAAAHGDRTLFSGLDLTLAPGDVVGVVGANGAGKSTLFRMLAGLIPAGSGQVVLSPATAIVGYLPQELAAVPGESVLDLIARRTGTAAAQAAFDVAADALADGRPVAGVSADDAYTLALDRWMALGGADIEERAEAVTHELGLKIDLATPTTALSRGQATRAGLAALLLSRYDVFLLDEPTNDLDLEGLERLERFLTGLRTGVAVVSHDREFLARTVTKVVELDLAQQEVSVYGGGYAAYLHEREVAARRAPED
jgi:ATPase subunit of ABC transporter with duplicated ATPase domains